MNESSDGGGSAGDILETFSSSNSFFGNNFCGLERDPRGRYANHVRILNIGFCWASQDGDGTEDDPSPGNICPPNIETCIN